MDLRFQQNTHDKITTAVALQKLHHKGGATCLSGIVDRLTASCMKIQEDNQAWFLNCTWRCKRALRGTMACQSTAARNVAAQLPNYTQQMHTQKFHIVASVCTSNFLPLCPGRNLFCVFRPASMGVPVLASPFWPRARATSAVAAAPDAPTTTTASTAPTARLTQPTPVPNRYVHI